MITSFETEYASSNAQTGALWANAMEQYLGFEGSPVDVIEGLDDDTFLAGPVFCATMKLLSGADPAGLSVRADLSAMRRAASTADAGERGHANAVELMVRGEFSAAARCWDKVLEDRPGDILAHKCAHETWFLVGDKHGMLQSAKAAIARLQPDHPSYQVAAAQYGFALEEVGNYENAEAWGRLAIDMVPSDCWALHCLAHVYETQNRHGDAMSLLEAKKPYWTKQNLLDAHIWWHLALRQVEAQEFGNALSIFDETLEDVPASNRFRLTDGTSLLWRLELEGVGVGDRWRGMAEKWAESATLHTSAFLDLHAALVFARCPDLPAATLFFDSLETAFLGDDSENAETFQTVLKPLASGLKAFRTDPHVAAQQIAPVLPALHRIGGSIVQREIVERSYSSALIASGDAAAAMAWLAPKLDRHPNTPWLLRNHADAADHKGNTAQATLMRRRADLMFAGWS